MPQAERTSPTNHHVNRSAKRMAARALAEAGRPHGADPRTVALALGVLPQPCAEEDAEVLVGAEAPGVIRFAWCDDEEERTRRVWHELARWLLRRAGASADGGMLDALARELAAPRN